VQIGELILVTDFYDSTDPAKIPSGAHAALYRDGDYAATTEQASRFAAVRWITVLGDWRTCGIADVENGDMTPGDARLWVKGRQSIGKRARVYCNRDTLPDVRTACDGLDYLVWISTLDGDKLTADWTPGLWAVQYEGGLTAARDTSVLYGTW
jgi:hypothetical protein